MTTLRARIHELRILNFELPGPELIAPSDLTYFAFWGWVFLGTDDEGPDRFDCFICSPRWLADHVGFLADTYSEVEEETGEVRTTPRTGPSAFFSPGLVVMSEWSEEAFESLLNQICEVCPGPDWPTIATRLSRYLNWDWDYKYDEYVDAHTERFRLPWGWRITGYW